MPRRKQRRTGRYRVGRVSYYCHHGGWFIYYRDRGRPIRPRVAANPADAERIAAQINAQLSTASPTLLACTPIAIPELRHRCLEHHGQVPRSSLATIRRYRTATLHLERYARQHRPQACAHELQPSAFVAYLRSLLIAPNGHPTGHDMLYDYAGRLATSIDALGNRPTTTFDTASRAIRVTNALGTLSTMIYDSTSDARPDITLGLCALKCNICK